MVINGGSRAGPDQLATHLLRTDTNERVTILELNSPIEDLRETFRDWQVLSTGTRGTKGLYHANIDPAMDYTMTRDQWTRAVDVLEEKLGLEGHPRAIVMHEKNGREHIHVVWQRTDVERMRLASDSYNYVAHEEASYQLETEFGHEHVPGKHAKRDRELQPEFPRAEFTHAEWQQMERTGEDRRARREHIRELYEASDTAQGFKAALEDDGYLLAKGDRRDFVLVDEYGHILSLSRELPGVPAKERREFLVELDPSSLPSVGDAKSVQAERAQARETARTEAQKELAQQVDRSPEGESTQKNESAPSDQRTPETEEQRRFREALERREAEELSKLRQKHLDEFTALEKSLDATIKEDMATFEESLTKERDRFNEEARERRKGMEGFREALDNRIRPQAALERQEERRKAWDDLLARQNIERRDQRTLLRQDKNQELDVLHERQAKEIAVLRRQHEGDRERYRQDQDAAERRAKELETEREWREYWEQVKRSRDGPDRGPTR